MQLSSLYKGQRTITNFQITDHEKRLYQPAFGSDVPNFGLITCKLLIIRNLLVSNEGGVPIIGLLYYFSKPYF